MGQHTQTLYGVGCSETVELQAITNRSATCPASLTLMPVLLRAKPSLPPQSAVWSSKPYAQGQGKIGAEQVFEATDASLFPITAFHASFCGYIHGFR